MWPNRRTPRSGTTKIFDLQSSAAGNPRMDSKARKRKADEHPKNRKRPRMDPPVQNDFPRTKPPTFNQKKNNKKKKSKPKKASMSETNSTLQENLYQDLIYFASTNNIFKSHFPRDELSNSGSVVQAIELPSVEDTSLTRLFQNQFVVNADNEIKRRVDSVAFPESRYNAILNTVIDELNKAVVIQGYENQWNYFGSYLYGLVNEDSDIDLYLECKSLHHDRDIRAELPAKVRKMLQKSKKFFKVTFIKSARVPLVRVIYGVLNKQLDISFSTKIGVWNSLLTKLFLKLNPNLKYLTLYLKEILKKYDILGTGRITTHILFWLVSFFMQQKKLLPVVSDVRDAATKKNYDSGWDCSLPENYSYPTRPVSLYSLLVEFFTFYKDFDFLKYVICPFLGRAFLLSDFEQFKLPEDKFAVYFEQMKNPEKTTFSRGTINLQDPTDLSFNLSKQVEINYANKFMIMCQCLSNSLPNSISELAQINTLNQIIPNKINFDSYTAHDLTQCWNFVLHSKNLPPRCVKKLNVINMLEITRKLMELIFEFEKKRIVIDEGRTNVYLSEGKILKNTASVIYFEYCSTANTWRNNFIRHINPRIEDELRVHLTCEICPVRNLVRVFVQGEANFVKFLRENSVKLFSFALDEILPF